MAHEAVLVDEIANELDTWPGVRVEQRADGAGVVFYERHELGLLDRQRGLVELGFPHPEHEALVEHGEAEPAEPSPASDLVSHDVNGPSDVTAALELFDRRYRELRGQDPPYSSEDPT